MPRLVRQRPKRVVWQLPQPVWAMQWHPGLQFEGIVGEWPARPSGAALLPLPAYAVLRTSLGNYTVFVDDWLVTEAIGYLFVMSNERFTRRYAAIEGQEGLFLLQGFHDESDPAATYRP